MNVRSNPILSQLDFGFIYFGQTDGYQQTQRDVYCFLDKWSSIGPLIFYWTSDGLLVLFAGRCVSTGLLFFFFYFRKVSSWPCVWNYTLGSKQGRLTEKKTAVRQWITVLWPDKCLSEEWMRKLKVRNHTHVVTHVLIYTLLYADSCALIHTERQQQNLKLSHFYYLDWICKSCNILYIMVPWANTTWTQHSPECVPL